MIRSSLARTFALASMVSLLLAHFAFAVAHAEKVVLVAGGGALKTGPATECRLNAPFGIDSDSQGNLIIVEMAGGERVLKIDTKGMLTVLAGTGQKGDSGDGGPAAQAAFNGMHTLAMGPSDTLYVGDTWNNRVRQLDLATRQIRAFAGTGKKSFGGDSAPALTADFGGVFSIAFDRSQKNLFLADLDNRRIRIINMESKIVRTVAGNGEKGVPPDGAEAIGAPLVDPRAVAVDSAGRVYILERGGHALRVVDQTGRIRTVVGTGRKGFEGDGGPASKATLNGPKHICVDGADNVIIADTDNHVIRKYLPKENRIIRVAGTGKVGTKGVGGPPEELELNQPHGVFVDKAGVLYIVDSLNNRVLKIVGR